MVQRRSYRDPVKEAYWRGVFVDWRASELSRRSFCEQRQLKLTTFDFWRKEIARRDAEEKSDSKPASPNATSTKASYTRSRGKTVQPLLMPLRVVSGGTIEIVLVNRRVIRVPDGVDPNHLRAVLAVTEEATC